mmetsp:Transcript_128467/g.256627  ORF Transcript_128467/g.256627 Transcript_128467/m.256627 type:complete len:88 (-) Transcript_128467:30-293(-)|eukprot:CAMPEP_0172720912 /NCGR_PEP_ID=MMETSP1074-20121228/77984_1 /TAXON_ID=2916 /ORGANISM="Ceratium fusus, Strain PA161109" /LENGTH=87 /DNA_ID=CAMNT_0013546535 /DNA_START=279 /DNA_END=542 /DNA_ORIENTATION=+
MHVSPQGLPSEQIMQHVEASQAHPDSFLQVLSVLIQELPQALPLEQTLQHSFPATTGANPTRSKATNIQGLHTELFIASESILLLQA